MAKQKVKIKKVDYKALTMKIFKIVFYLALLVGVGLAIYQAINWHKVFNKEYQSSIFVEPAIELPPILGTSTIKYEEKKWLAEFIKKLKIQKVIIQQLEVGEASDVYLKTDKNILIKVNTDSEMDFAWNTFSSIYFSDEIQKAIDKKLEYIDIRFGNKVFYKLENKNTTTENIINTNNSTNTKASTTRTNISTTTIKIPATTTSGLNNVNFNNIN